MVAQRMLKDPEGHRYDERWAGVRACWERDSTIVDYSYSNFGNLNYVTVSGNMFSRDSFSKKDKTLIETAIKDSFKLRADKQKADKKVKEQQAALKAVETLLGPKFDEDLKKLNKETSPQKALLSPL
jgi:hypothetical protein